jgi:predicted glycoside hydrolase/deacetylase ChbG (UPF0249 family)
MRSAKNGVELVATVVTVWSLGGCATGEKYLIIHSDDAGMCHSVNRATIDGMEKGIVSSTSIMVPCPWFKEFAAYAKEHAEKDYGIHITLTCEWDAYQWGPVAGRENVPSLVDEKGYMWDSTELVAKHAKAEEVEIEIRAQIDRAKKFGVPLSHLDTHMGAVLCRADIAEIYAKLGLEYNLPVLFYRVPPILLAMSKQYAHLAPVAEPITKQLDARHLPILDHLSNDNYGVPTDKKKDFFLKAIRNLKPGVTQIIIHCGYADPELSRITTSAERREADMRAFVDPQVIAEVEKLGIKVITWKQFHQMTLAKANEAAAGK